MIYEISPAAIFVVCCAAACLPAGEFTALCAAALIHESAHAVCAVALGYKIKGIRLTPSGVSMIFPDARSYRHAVMIAVCGPLANLATCFVSDGRLFTYSALLATVNLMPLFSLDGQTVLSGISHLLLPLSAADALCHAVGAVFTAAAWIISVYILFFSGANMAMLIFVSWLFAETMLKGG
ncbi:MAG: hypothetical protein MJ101_01815 [Clostridia bacterium]|nr:hypothetical protein [Clostridia bacterium]